MGSQRPPETSPLRMMARTKGGEARDAAEGKNYIYMPSFIYAGVLHVA